MFIPYLIRSACWLWVYSQSCFPWSEHRRCKVEHLTTPATKPKPEPKILLYQPMSCWSKARNLQTQSWHCPRGYGPNTQTHSPLILDQAHTARARRARGMSGFLLTITMRKCVMMGIPIKSSLPQGLGDRTAHRHKKLPLKAQCSPTTLHPVSLI